MNTVNAHNLVSLAYSRKPPQPSRPRATVFTNPSSQSWLKPLERVAPSNASVLIVGESGTGKEVMARHIHALSERKGPFVAVNCGALAASLAEAELFGHEAGAYTGATSARAGWFESAQGGTLFLDEIGDLSPALQVKILRVLQEREVVRVGSRKVLPIDVRLIAATNADLTEAVAAGRFRRDLFYRLNVASLALPPLRERIDEILPLAEHFVRTHSESLRAPPPRLMPETQQALLEYSWPGNIRELENVMQVALLVREEQWIRPQDLRFTPMPLKPAPHIGGRSQPPSVADNALEACLAPLERLFAQPPPQLFEQFGATIIREAYAFCGGNQVRSARLLGISRNILRTQLKRHGLVQT